MAAVVRGLGIQGAGLAPDRHPADSPRASAKTLVSDPEATGPVSAWLIAYTAKLRAFALNVTQVESHA